MLKSLIWKSLSSSFMLPVRSPWQPIFTAYLKLHWPKWWLPITSLQKAVLPLNGGSFFGFFWTLISQKERFISSLHPKTRKLHSGKQKVKASDSTVHFVTTRWHVDKVTHLQRDYGTFVYELSVDFLVGRSLYTWATNLFCLQHVKNDWCEATILFDKQFFFTVSIYFDFEIGSTLWPSHSKIKNNNNNKVMMLKQYRCSNMRMRSYDNKVYIMQE